MVDLHLLSQVKYCNKHEHAARTSSFVLVAKDSVVHLKTHTDTLTLAGWVPLDGCGIYPDSLKDRRALVAGPLCRSVGDLVMFLETVVGSRAESLAAKVASTDIRNLKIWLATLIVNNT